MAFNYNCSIFFAEFYCYPVPKSAPSHGVFGQTNILYFVYQSVYKRGSLCPTSSQAKWQLDWFSKACQCVQYSQTDGIPVNIRHIIHCAQQRGQKGIILLLIIKPYYLLTQQLLTFHPSHGINNQQWSGTQSRISSTDVLDSTKIHLSTSRWTRSTNEHRAAEINQQLLINISFTSPSKHNAYIPTVVRILVHCTAAVKAACRTAWWKLFWYRGMDGYSEAGEYGNSKIWRQMRSGHCTDVTTPVHIFGFIHVKT